MAKKMRCFDVSVVFEGVMQYTIEAKNEEDAKKQAEELFAEENPAVVQANVMQTTTTVDMEANAT